MATERREIPVSEVRERISDVVNRALYGGEITYITRGRSRRRAAAVIPMALLEKCEALLAAEGCPCE